ncbi:FHA domain-containing protein [bacterium]|nr:FHA domain-containing protein [candidate division CSSED10-310 bacterium]
MKSWLIVEEGAERGGTYHLSSKILTIGRGPANPIQIVDTSVSRQHAQLRFMEDHYIITDMNSRNGTFINTKRIRQPTPLQNGDTVQIGNVVMLYLTGDGPEDQPDLVKSWKKATATTRFASTIVLKTEDIETEAAMTDEFETPDVDS